MKPTRRLEELLDKKIVAADGKKVGHVFDIQLSRDGENRVIALMYGQKSLLFRLHVYQPAAIAFRLEQQPRVIPWEAVENVDRAAVRLKPGYQPGRKPGRRVP
jgi:sporulation protein YlmC with PRC-barrel domain